VTVHLVGAGPGDPGLLTARALELIAAADVIVYDRLIPESALDGARPDALRIYVGKRPGRPSMPQSEIDRLLVEHGTAGSCVVRLKGGDPFVFGRGGEEAEALRAAGIAYEVVPGVTAGIAAAAYAGIPVTYRETASAVAFLTGHEDPATSELALDWRALASFPGTLVVYMGVRSLQEIAARLLDGGRSPDEPAAFIERGSFADQRSAVASLSTITRVAREHGVRAPAIFVFGQVAALGDKLAWLERRPLSGVTVAITREHPQAGGLADSLRTLGAAVVAAPVIQIRRLPGPPPSLDGVDLLILTSANGVDALFERFAAAGLDARVLAGIRVAAIGPGTAAALRAHGVIADVVPERFVAEGLVEALSGVDVRRAIVARAAQARDVVVDALRARGAVVEVLALYETVPQDLTSDQIDAALAADYVTFTSASTVRFFLSAAGQDAVADSQARLVSIGPVTSETLRAHGARVDVEATRHDIGGLLDALLDDAAAARQGGGGH
jgi:uroporphyrinogen III methyltransferase/synthase